MTKEAIRVKLTKHGYKVVHDMSGTYLATKGQRTYSADTLTALYRAIFN